MAIAIRAFAIEEKKPELGVWFWTQLTELSESELNNVIEKAESDHFTALYLSVEDLLPLLEMPDGIVKKEKLRAYQESLAHFISLAKNKNIVIDAVAGEKEWAEKENRIKPERILAFFSQYQKAHPDHSFRALQFDIEPYLLASYEGNKSHILLSYIELVDDLVNQGVKDDIELNFVIPHFYDSAQEWTPEINYNQITAYPFNHLLRIMDRQKKGQILIMSYRNMTEGENGSIALSEKEILDAEKTKHVNVLVAQEVGDVEPHYVTFFGRPKKELLEKIQELQSTFKDKKSFAGIAINYWDPFQELE